MYDRRIDGKEYVFGNQGALYMSAMTWWDRETGSVWSQVTGEALSGPLAGTALRQIPAAVETWTSWRASHPDTEVLAAGGYGGQPADPNFVVGLRLQGDALAISFPFAADRGAVNVEVGGTPMVVFARRAGLAVRVYVRTVGASTISFELRDGLLTDPATGTTWDPITGRGVSGPLAGQQLVSMPWSTAYGWAWRNFYPNTRTLG